MRQTIPWGGHHLYDVVVARRLQRFYDRVAGRRPEALAILDIGCGPGHLAAALARTHPAARVTGVDLDPTMVAMARKAHRARNLVYREGASTHVPVAQESQDWVLATETFHHWKRPEEALREIHRVLRPGGELWIVEGAGDMTRRELEAWTGRRPFPGLTTWVRLVFARHGYTTRRLRRQVLPRVEASPFGAAQVVREDGWWIVRATKR